MLAEGVVHALRKTREALVAGGTLLDMHPGFADSTVSAGGQELGRLDEREFRSEMSHAEPALAQAVEEGLFAIERETFFVLLHRFSSGAACLQELANWRGTRIPPELRDRIEAARPPVEVRERCVLRRLRAL